MHSLFKSSSKVYKWGLYLRNPLKQFCFNNLTLLGDAAHPILPFLGQGGAMAIDVGCKLDIGLIVSCSGYHHPNWKPGQKFPPTLISHGLKDEVVPISASKIMYKKIKSISRNFCELNEFKGYHQIDPELIHYINLKINQLF